MTYFNNQNFQGFGVGPSFITIAKWYPKQERGRYGAIWNITRQSSPNTGL